MFMTLPVGNEMGNLKCKIDERKLHYNISVQI